MTKPTKIPKTETLPIEDYDGSTPVGNDKHELFANKCAEYFGNKHKAYKDVYGKNATRNNAVNLFSTNQYVQKRYRYLVDVGLKAASLSREERLQEVREEMYKCLEEGDRGSYVKLHDIVMKLQGENKTSVDVTSGGKELDNGANVIVDAELVKDALSKFNEDF